MSDTDSENNADNADNKVDTNGSESAQCIVVFVGPPRTGMSSLTGEAVEQLRKLVCLDYGIVEKVVLGNSCIVADPSADISAFRKCLEQLSQTDAGPYKALNKRGYGLYSVTDLPPHVRKARMNDISGRIKKL